MSPRHVAAYLRISQDRLGLQAGVDRQWRDCLAVADRLWPGVEVVRYEDNDTSAYLSTSRPAYERLVSDLTAGQLEGVVAWDQDRLFRRPVELESLISLCERVNFTQLTTAQGELDLTTHEGRFKARIMAAVAAKSSDDTSRRVRRAKADARASGRFLGGPLPYGVTSWKGDVKVIDPMADRVVTEAAQRVLEGHTWADLTEWCPDPSAPRTAYGWRNMLLTTTLGDPIVLADVRAHLESRDPLPRSRVRRWWLAGLLTCGACGAKLRRSVKGTWTCRNGYHVSILDKLVEPAVRAALFDIVRVRGERETPPPAGADGGAISPDVQGRLDELAEWRAARQAVAPPVVQPPVVSVPVPVELSEVWASLAPVEQHRLASAVVRAVEVGAAGKDHGGRVPVDQRLTFHWIQ